MKVTFDDTIETAHTSLLEIYEAAVQSQDGLTILSAQDTNVDGISGVRYQLLGRKGATVDLPIRLAKRLIKIGHASQAE